MSNLWHAIDIRKELVGVVEMPTGTNMKLELDKGTGALKLDRFIKIPVPAHYGFIPQTLADDDDPLDVFIFSSKFIPSLTIVKIRPERVIHAIDNGKGDAKIIATVVGDNLDWTGATKRTDLVLDYLRRYKEGMEVIAVLDHKVAEESIKISYNNYMQKYSLHAFVSGGV